MNKPMNEIFSANLRNALYMAGRTQSELARAVGVTDVSVSKWVNGTAVPRPKMIEKICMFLRCRREDLLLDHTKTAMLAPEDVLAEEMRKRPDLYVAFNELMNLHSEDLKLVLSFIGRLSK